MKVFLAFCSEAVFFIVRFSICIHLENNKARMHNFCWIYMQKTPVSYSNTVDRVVLKLPHYSLGLLNPNKIQTHNENYSKCHICIFDILAFYINFCLVLTDLSGNTV